MKSKKPNGTSKFGTAFNEAKKSGKKTFTYQGKKYTTQTAEEKSKKMSMSQLRTELNRIDKKAFPLGEKGMNRDDINKSRAYMAEATKRIFPNSVTKKKK